MKQQIITRLGVAHVRDILSQFVAGEIDRFQAMESLQISQSRLYAMKASFLRAVNEGRLEEWCPGASGGNHMPAWPKRVHDFLYKVLGSNGNIRRYSYAFAASELGRLYNFPVDRSQVRHWAMAHHLHLTDYRARPPAHIRRWERKSIGELWQLDATPDRFLGHENQTFHLIDMIDDCSRVQVGCKLYERETVASYLDLFYWAFSRYGLPLEIYVDKAGFFKNAEGTLTQLGERLKFYDISFVFANTPEAKGKIERLHKVWQERLPAYVEREGLMSDTTLEDVNNHLEQLVDYRNRYELHRELQKTPLAVWEEKLRTGQSKLRVPPQDGWWELVWSEWKGAMIGPRGKLIVNGILCSTECANGTRVWICHHVDGTISLVLNKPEKGTSPKVVFTNNPRVFRRG